MCRSEPTGKLETPGRGVSLPSQKPFQGLCLPEGSIFGLPRVDLNPGVSLLGKSTPGFKFTLGSKNGTVSESQNQARHSRDLDRPLATPWFYLGSWGGAVVRPVEHWKPPCWRNQKPWGLIMAMIS